MAKQVTPAQFRVLMGELNDAVGVVGTHARIVHETLGEIGQDLRHVADLWASPASLTFEPLRSEYQRSSQDLDDVLAGIHARMRITYQNYLDAELKATQNLAVEDQDDKGGAPPAEGNKDHNVLAVQNGPAVRPSQRTAMVEVHEPPAEMRAVILRRAGS